MALDILLLSDGRPGHYHLSDGVVLAISRRIDVNVARLTIKKRKIFSNRLMRGALKLGLISPARFLAMGYGIDATELPKADLVVSAGGNTLIANVSAAKILSAQNIFCGSLRGIDPELFSLVLTSFERFSHLANHMVCLKPSMIDPEKIGRPAVVPTFGIDNPPKVAGLLVGGNSGLFSYDEQDWRGLLDHVRQLSAAWGTRWIISTSPRTGDTASDLIADFCKDTQVVQEFIDFRVSGPGTLERVFGASDIVVCTEDSSSMISEAISARLPVLGVSPVAHSFETREAEYRAYLMDQGWCRSLPIADLSPERLSQALSEIAPLQDNHLDILAGKLEERLPALFGR